MGALRQSGRIRRWLGPALLPAAVPWLLFAGHGCSESGPRIYTAQAYNADADCLDHYAPLGLVETSDDLSAKCDPVCLRVDDQLYLSTLCPPYPPEATVDSVDPNADPPIPTPECERALAVLRTGAFCDDEPDAAAPADDAAAPDQTDAAR